MCAAGPSGRGGSAMSLAELEARQDPTAELAELLRERRCDSLKQLPADGSSLDCMDHHGDAILCMKYSRAPPTRATQLLWLFLWNGV